MGGARDREALTRNRESGVGNRESGTWGHGDFGHRTADIGPRIKSEYPSEISGISLSLPHPFSPSLL